MTTTFKGTPIMIAGIFPKVGDKAPEFYLTQNDLSEFSLKDGKGHYLILNIFPSLHQHTDQRAGIRQQESAEQSDHQRETDFFQLGDRTELLHLDLPFFRGGQGFHDRGLNDRHQSHVAVRRHRYCTQQFRGKTGSQDKTRL